MKKLEINTPDTIAINARHELEKFVIGVYSKKGISVSEHTSLLELVEGEPFKEFIGSEKLLMSARYVLKLGKIAEHKGKISKKEAEFSQVNLDKIVGATQQTKATTNISEAETRERFIDLMLRESGWEILTTEGAILPQKACIEVEVTGMPNAEGKGYADYVLFGASGIPLAVVEAKRTSVSPIKGKHQAELYADCLEKQYGVRPVIYYTNGFETNIIDGLGYPPRRLFGFHTAKDLELIIQKRGRADITDFSVKDNITDRYYQKMAIKAVCEHYNKKHRRGLLVMATGTGKTRVAISLVDVLQRNGWIKNTLFLADRISLINQAHKNFIKLLPNDTTCVLSNNNNDKDLDARIVFSTYQTMINYIDTDEKPFSVGRFDLIIIDESHRSIFGKYGAIFNYFDAMMLGLTATPREEVDKSTYDIFEMEQGEPNYAYELENAVSDGFLVNYHGFKRGSFILEEGIKYDKLSNEEKKQMEAIWEYEQTRKALDVNNMHGKSAYVVPNTDDMLFAAEPPIKYLGRDIASNEIFSYIFNESTIDAVLQDLMTNGQKVQSGERIGKTIIFAYNHHHAELIVKRFNILYPEYGPDFCALIDNYVTYSQSLIDKFEIRNGNPQVAVSVDMLDTGIDVPDVLNLVFFKAIKSKIKFMQMIGRGTRLSSNIFGEGKDKDCFYIFDWCRNFDYFEKNPKGKEILSVVSLTERLFGLRVDIVFNLQHQKYQEDDYCKYLHDNIKTLLREQVCALSDSHISVREKWEDVSHFKDIKNWTYISDLDVLALKNNIAPLIHKNTLDENAKKFDILTLTIELSYLNNEVDATKCIQKVQFIAEKLQDKASLPQVQAKIDTIKEVLSPVAWENANLQWLEKVRTELRELLKFLVGEQGKWFIVDIDDVVSYNGENTGIQCKFSYKQRVLDFLSNNRQLPVINKIYNIEQLTISDIKELERILWQELGNKDEYNEFTADKYCGSNVAIFIRSMVGINRAIALKIFTHFISENNLNSQQEEYLMTIINYVCENGDIKADTLINDSPFNEYQLIDIWGTNVRYVGKFVEKLHTAITA